MMLRKKGAIELSMNFLVILIVSLIVFTSGISLFWKIYKSGETELGQVSQAVERKILRQLHGGSKVSVVPRSFDLKRDRGQIVGIGINNVETTRKEFKIFLQRGLFVRSDKICSFYENDDDYPCNDVPELKLLAADTAIGVDPNNLDISEIMIKADSKALSGEYIVSVCVCDKDTSGCIDYSSCKGGASYDQNYPVSKIRINVL